MNDHAPGAAEGDLSHYDIMVVDDIPENLRLVSRILEARGGLVRAALSGPIALEAIRHQLPDLLILDIRMPDMDGFEVCRRIKADPDLRDIPIIFISARHELTDKVKAFSMGGVDYLSKPFEAEEVIARVKTHLTINTLKRRLQRTNEILEEKVRVRTESLKKSQQKYLDLYDNAPDMLLSVDVKTFEILECNHTLARITGYSKAELIGRPVSRLYTAGSWEYVKTTLLPLFLQTGVIEGKELQLRLKNGTIMDILINASAVRDDHGEILCSRSSWRDITKRKQMEEMMIQSEKMLSVGGLAAGMAHEINNPIAGLIQTANVVANRLGEKLDIPASRKAAMEAGTSLEAIRRFMEARNIMRMLSTIQESACRVAAIVENMLSFARKSDAQVSSHNLSRLLDKTLELAATEYDLKKRYDFKKIEIRKEYEDKGCLVPCEAAKIQQVLLNILRNGGQAMQEAKTTAPCFILRTRVEKERNMACMEIEDNGPGMDEETRKRAFEPFFTTKPEGTGTGLGLSVSYFIITENHGGELTLESRPGFGATFIICLPLSGPPRKTI